MGFDITLNVHRRISTADTNAAVVKSSPADLYGYLVVNTNAAVRYLKLYDKATTPDENDTPVMTIALAASAGQNTPIVLTKAIAFRNGLAMRLVTGVADNSTGAAAAGEQVVHLFYR